MMKTIKLTQLLVLALALTLAATGCKKKPTPLTPLPGPPPTVFRDQGPRTLEPGGTLRPSQPGRPGSYATSDTWSPDDPNLVIDTAALAAYTVHFDFDSSVVKSSEQVNVEAVAAALRLDSATKLLIQGHCDERGTEEYNRSLGEHRALALREALARLAVDANRIRTESFGKDKPVAMGHNEAAWSQNRRGVFVLFHPKQ
jgi:outer membrane protein OmpA-like peptidoglycan-associated protein